MKNANPKTWFLPIIGGNRYSAGAPFANLTASRLDAGDARSAALAVLSGGAPFFSDPFTSGDLRHTENGVAWGASNAGAEGGDSVGVVSNKLQFVFAAGGDAWAEQRFTFGTTNAYPEIYGRLLLTLPSDFVPPGDNAKGLFTFWSNKYNNTDPGYEDGYSSSTELFIGNEMTPNGAGGCRGNIRIVLNGYDINVQGGGSYLSSGSSLIAASDAGKTIEFVQRVKASTVDGTHGNYNEDFLDTTPGLNGAFQIWKRIPSETSVWTLVVDKTGMNAYPPVDWNGFNRGYILGWINGGFSTTQIWLVDDVEFATTDVWGCSI